MKKALALLAIGALSCLSSCVEDPQNVMLVGFVDESNNDGDTLKCSTSNNMYTSGLNNNVSCSLSAFIQNNLATEKPWSSSGSSSSGSTFDTEIPAYNTIFVTSIVLSCDSIDGDSDKCEGHEDIEYNIGQKVSAGGSACLQLDIHTPAFKDWGSVVVLKAYAKYHDSGRINGKTSSTYLTISPYVNGCVPKMDESEAGSSGDGSGAETDPSKSEK